jgi:hypothetical protein
MTRPCGAACSRKPRLTIAPAVAPLSPPAARRDCARGQQHRLPSGIAAACTCRFQPSSCSRGRARAGVPRSGARGARGRRGRCVPGPTWPDARPWACSTALHVSSPAGSRHAYGRYGPAGGAAAVGGAPCRVSARSRSRSRRRGRRCGRPATAAAAGCNATHVDDAAPAACGAAVGWGCNEPAVAGGSAPLACLRRCTHLDKPRPDGWCQERAHGGPVPNLQAPGNACSTPPSWVAPANSPSLLPRGWGLGVPT